MMSSGLSRIQTKLSRHSMPTIKFAKRFKKDLLKWLRSGRNLRALDELVLEVHCSWPPSKKFEAHLLLGKHAGIWDIHLQQNLIVLAKFDGFSVHFLRLGTHDDLKL